MSCWVSMSSKYSIRFTQRRILMSCTQILSSMRRKDMWNEGGQGDTLNYRRNLTNTEILILECSHYVALKSVLSGRFESVTWKIQLAHGSNQPPISASCLNYCNCLAEGMNILMNSSTYIISAWVAMIWRSTHPSMQWSWGRFAPEERSMFAHLNDCPYHMFYNFATINI